MIRDEPPPVGKDCNDLNTFMANERMREKMQKTNKKYEN